MVNIDLYTYVLENFMFCDPNILKFLFYIDICIYIKIKYFIFYVIFGDDKNVEVSKEHHDLGPTIFTPKTIINLSLLIEVLRFG